MKAIKLCLLLGIGLLTASFSAENSSYSSATTDDLAFYARQFAHLNRVDPIDLSSIPSLLPLQQHERVYFASAFGMRKHPVLKKMMMHPGQDFAAPSGTIVLATADGIVSRAWANAKRSGYGKQIMIEHEEAFEDLHIRTRYAHLSRIFVTEGQLVQQGDTIALSGNTGLSTAPHLHYEVFENDRQVDPAKYIR